MSLAPVRSPNSTAQLGSVDLPALPALEEQWSALPHLWVGSLKGLYVRLGPRERWLRKLTGLLAVAGRSLSSVFLEGNPFCGVYAWVSVLTGKQYVGSSVDFKKWVYAHVCSMRQAPKQCVHKFLRGFGKHLFFVCSLCPW